MSGEQSRSAPHASPGAAACVICGAGVEATRCEQCGVAVSPGGWRILRELAKGPHSRVFLAERNGEQVALKELLFALVPDAAQLDGFEREARLLSQLSHPSIPKLVEFFREGQAVHTRLYLAQQFVRGRSLLQQLDGHRFDEKETTRLARELLEVLGYLHGLSPRVIHRDVKPANVMRREDGSLALVDFGSARDLVKGITHGSTLVGTFGYMPPEQLGGTVDLTSDLYALGATLLHLLSRKPPEEFLKPGMELAFDDEVNVSDGFRGWLHQLVQRDRSARFQSAKAALDALDALDRPAKIQESPKERPKPSDPPPKPLLALLSMGGIAVAIAAAVAISLTGDTQTSRSRTASPPPITVVAPPVVRPPRPVPPVAPTPSHAEVVTVPKPAPVSAFILEEPLTFELSTVLPLADHDAAGTACPSPSSLAISRVNVLPGVTPVMQVSTALSNHGGPTGCSNAFVEVLDQTGARVTATLVSNATEGTTKKAELSFPLPANGRKFQLRLGPQAKPYGVFALDLGAKRLVQR